MAVGGMAAARMRRQVALSQRTPSGNLKPPPAAKKPVKRTAKQAMEDAAVERGQSLKEWAIEVGLFIAWLLCFTLSVFITRQSELQFRFTGMWKDMMDTEDVSSVGDFLEFLAPPESDAFSCEQAVLDDLPETVEISPVASIMARDYLVADPGFPMSNEEGVLQGNFRVGPVRIRQLRVQGNECPATQAALRPNITTQCYPLFDKSIEETEFSKPLTAALEADKKKADPSYTAPEIPFFKKWQSAEVLGERSFGGEFGSYPGNGYVIDLYNMCNLTEVHPQIVDERWIDFKTRAIFLDFASYSPSMDIFVIARILFEFLPGGEVVPSGTFRALNLDRYPMNSGATYLHVLLEAITGLFVVWYMIEEIREIKSQGFKSYFSLGWNWYDWINLILFLIAGYFKAQAVTVSSALLSDPAKLNNSPADLQRVAAFYSLETQILGFNLLLMWAKLFKYLQITHRLKKLATTLTRSAVDILTFLFIFVVVLTAYSVMGVMVFGNDVEAYVTFSASFKTLFLVIFGEFDMEALESVNAFLGVFFLFTWMLISALILINMFVAILSEVYAEVSEEPNKELSVAEKILGKWSKVAEREKLIQIGRGKIAPEPGLIKPTQWKDPSADIASKMLGFGKRAKTNLKAKKDIQDAVDDEHADSGREEVEANDSPGSADPDAHYSSAEAIKSLGRKSSSSSVKFIAGSSAKGRINRISSVLASKNIPQNALDVPENADLDDLERSSPRAGLARRPSSSISRRASTASSWGRRKSMSQRDDYGSEDDLSDEQGYDSGHSDRHRSRRSSDAMAARQRSRRKSTKPRVLKRFGPWRECEDPDTGESYFWNKESGVVTWTHPSDLGPSVTQNASVHAGGVPEAHQMQQPGNARQQSFAVPPPVQVGSWPSGEPARSPTVGSGSMDMLQANGSRPQSPVVSSTVDMGFGGMMNSNGLGRNGSFSNSTVQPGIQQNTPINSPQPSYTFNSMNTGVVGLGSGINGYGAGPGPLQGDFQRVPSMPQFNPSSPGLRASPGPQ